MLTRGESHQKRGRQRGEMDATTDREKRPIRLRTYIILLIAVTLAPISAFGAFLGLLNPIREREAIRQGMTDTARALSLAVDRQARIAITGLQALATAPSLLEGDYASFRQQAERFLASHEGWISVVDETGQQHLNTRLDPAASLPRTDNRVWLGHIFGARDVYITGAVTGPVVRQPVVAISLRVPRPIGPVVLTLSIAPETLTRLLQEQVLPDGWIGVVADGDGTIIGRTQGPDSDRTADDRSANRSLWADIRSHSRRNARLHRMDHIQTHWMVYWSGCSCVSDRR